MASLYQATLDTQDKLLIDISDFPFEIGEKLKQSLTRLLTKTKKNEETLMDLN
jgi:hypothetical protein